MRVPAVETSFDVFLSYNTSDRPSVKVLADKLVACGIRVWLDYEEIAPATSLVQSIDKGLRGSRAIAIIVGPGNLGSWQTPEVEGAIATQIKRGTRAFAVILPGTSDAVVDALPLFLVKDRYVDFREGLENEDGFFNLRWGITGTKPERKKPAKPGDEQAIAAPAPDDTVEEAIEDLVQTLKTQNVTFFLGPGAAYGSTPMPAQAYDIARDLLEELKIIEATYKELLPPVDVASLYFGIRSGDRLLQQRVTERVADKSRVFPQTHDRLAELMKLLGKRPERRSGGRNLQLLVTTNLDLMMERALLRAGLSFTRIVQFRTGKRIEVKEYHNVQLIGGGIVQLPDEDGNPQQARVDNFVELDRLIMNFGKSPVDKSGNEESASATGLKFSNLTEPILYKFLGSQDIDDSCVISTLHHFEFARGVLQQKGLPDELTSTIRNSTILFLGLWFMDPDFRLTYYTLLRDALRLENDRRYALQLPPTLFADDVYRKMERGIWEKIKEAGVRQIGITPLEEPCDKFLKKLYIKVEEELRL